MSSGACVNQSKPRQAWLDALKGLGIVLVVLGHLPQVARSDVGAAIYSFHIPLFFALSGATLQGCSLLSMLRRMLSLLWVYFVVGVLSLPFALGATSVPTFWQAFLGLIYGSPLTLQIGPLWFLPALALAIVLAWVAMLWVAPSDRRLLSQVRLLVIGSALMVLASLIFAQEPPRHALEHRLDWGCFARAGVFWSADVAVLGAGFVVLGAVVHSVVSECSQRMSLILGAVAVLVFLILFQTSPRVELAFAVWPDPWRASLGASAAILALSVLSKLFAQHLTWLAAVGRATLPILVLHVVVYTLLKPILVAADVWLAVPLALLGGVALPWVIDKKLLSENALVSWVFYPRKIIDRWLANISR